MNKHDIIAAGIVRDAFEVKKPTAPAVAVDRVAQAARDAHEKRGVEDLGAAASARTQRLHAALISQLIAEKLEVGLGEVDLPALEEAGRLTGVADDTGLSEYTFEGKVLVTFNPPHVGFASEGEDTAMLVQLEFRLPL